MSTVAGIKLPDGDQAAVAGAAAALDRVAGDFAGAEGTLRRALASVPDWSGVASISFADVGAAYGTAGRTAQQACARAAAAARAYGRRLEEAQTRVRSIQHQAEDCVRRIDAANRRAADASARAGSAELRSLGGAFGAIADGGAAAAAARREAAAAVAERDQAEGAAAAAEGELQRLRRQADQEHERVLAAGRTAAHEIRASARALPRVDGLSSPGGTHGRGGSGVPWSDIMLAARLGSSAAFVPAVYKVLPYIETAQSWWAVAPGSPLAGYADRLALEHFPTWNNGLLGKAAGAGLRRLPGRASAAGTFLGDAARATPFFTKVGIGTGVIGTGLGAYHIYGDVAHHKGGDQLASDITGTAFSGATVAFLVAPNPVTGGAVIVTGVAWGGAEAWQHRRAIGHAAKSAGEFVWDTSAPGLLWNNRRAIGGALDAGVDLAGEGLKEAGDGLSKVGHTLDPRGWF